MTSFRTLLSLLCGLSFCFLCATPVNAELVNGDFSVNSLGSGSADYSDKDAGWFAKNPGTNWVINTGPGVAEQVGNNGTATRLGQGFSAGDMNGTGWSFEFTLDDDTINRVTLYAGKETGSPPAGNTLFGSGADSAPAAGIVDGSGWTTLFDTNADAIPLSLGLNSIPISQDLSDFDIMSLTFRGNGGSVGTLISDVRFVAPNVAVPEPTSIATWSLLGVCLAGYGYRRRRSS